MTARALPRLDEDRLTPILDHLAQGFTLGISSEYSSAPDSGEAVTADMIDDLARKHFPLCMRMLHNNLREDSHLKHQGRLQYGLFLKVSRVIKPDFVMTGHPDYWSLDRGSTCVLETSVLEKDKRREV